MIVPMLLALAAPIAAPEAAPERLAFAPVHSVMHVALDREGEIASCTIDAQGTVAQDFTEGACEAFQEFGILSLLLGGDRNRISAASIVVDMGPAGLSASSAAPGGLKLAGIDADYAVAPDGRLTRCVVTRRQGLAMGLIDLCEMAFASGQQFEPGSGDRRGTISLSVYGELRPGA